MRDPFDRYVLRLQDFVVQAWPWRRDKIIARYTVSQLVNGTCDSNRYDVLLARFEIALWLHAYA